MDGFPVAPAAVPHGFFLRPSEMIGEGSEAAAKTVQAEGNVKDEIIEANNRIKKSAYSDDRRRLIFLLPL